MRRAPWKEQCLQRWRCGQWVPHRPTGNTEGKRPNEWHHGCRTEREDNATLWAFVDRFGSALSLFCFTVIHILCAIALLLRWASAAYTSACHVSATFTGLSPKCHTPWIDYGPRTSDIRRYSEMIIMTSLYRVRRNRFVVDFVVVVVLWVWINRWSAAVQTRHSTATSSTLDSLAAGERRCYQQSFQPTLLRPLFLVSLRRTFSEVRSVSDAELD